MIVIPIFQSHKFLLYINKLIFYNYIFYLVILLTENKLKKLEKRYICEKIINYFFHNNL